MADPAKHAAPVSVSDFKSLFSVHKTRRTVAFLYGFMLASLLVTVFFAFSPSTNSAAPWLTNVFAVGGDNGGSSSGYRSQVSSIFSYLFPNSTSTSYSSSSAPTGLGFVPGESNSSRSDNRTRSASNSDIRGASSERNNASSVHGVNQEQSVAKNQTVQSTSQLNQTRSSSSSDKTKVSNSNQTRSSGNSEEGKVSEPSQKQNRNQTQSLSSSSESQASRSNLTAKLKPESPKSENKTANSPKSENKATNSPKSENKTANSPKSENKTANSPKSENKATNSPKSENKATNSPKSENKTADSPKSEKNSASNETALFSEKKKKKSNGSVSVGQGMNGDDSVESLRKCDFFDGTWVREDSYGLYYKPGSCSLVDEQFNCVANGRPDLDFQKFKWKPKGCSIPRLDGKKMLEMLRGKRLVFVGDSLNRNMWESLVCILKNSVKDPSKVYEAHGRHSFRTDASYSFIFKDYGCTVEFFVTPFLVQEWDVKGKNGTKKETLRLDMMSKSAENYKTADVIVFNTGHWWTHDKTSKGEDYYQEGDTVYKQLNVLDAFRKAITTWGKWIDKNVNPKKSLVFFRGYSHSHFSGGQWNSGGACNSETVPISNETFLRPYLTKMTILEKVFTGMKTEVTYLNVTKMTDFRKDAHPSIYRLQNTPEEERRSPLKYQDCSHWCLPGVPDTWNEVLYAKLLVKFGQKRT